MQITTPNEREVVDSSREDPPTRWSRIAEIAAYVEWRIADLSFSYDPATGGDEFVPVGRATVRAFCEDEGFPWNSVAVELRKRHFAAFPKNESTILKQSTASWCARMHFPS